MPIFAKASLFFVGLLAFAAILYIAKDIIVPIVFAVIFAIVHVLCPSIFAIKPFNRFMDNAGTSVIFVGNAYRIVKTLGIFIGRHHATHIVDKTVNR